MCTLEVDIGRLGKWGFGGGFGGGLWRRRRRWRHRLSNLPFYFLSDSTTCFIASLYISLFSFAIISEYIVTMANGYPKIKPESKYIQILSVNNDGAQKGKKKQLNGIHQYSLENIILVSAKLFRFNIRNLEIVIFMMIFSW